MVFSEPLLTLPFKSPHIPTQIRAKDGHMRLTMHIPTQLGSLG